MKGKVVAIEERKAIDINGGFNDVAAVGDAIEVALQHIERIADAAPDIEDARSGDEGFACMEQGCTSFPPPPPPKHPIPKSKSVLVHHPVCCVRPQSLIRRWRTSRGK